MSRGFGASSCSTGSVIRTSWVKDLNFDRGELTIRDGKGGKDRVTMLPATLTVPLRDHLAGVKAQHNSDLALGRGSVALPGALRTKYPNGPREWAWQ